MKIIKKLLFLLLTSLASLALILPAKAVCPVCTVAVVAGVGLSRWLGIDDTIAGLWIGGMAVSLIAWTINWLNKKNVHFKFRNLLTAIVYYGLIIPPLFWTNIMGHPLNKIWGMDKLLLGIIFGSLLFLAGVGSYAYLKKKNNDKAHFPFQKVVMPVAPLVITSVIFYFLTK